jgi:hypothetical protein
VKYKVDAFGRKTVDDIIVIENKLSSTTPLTSPQTSAMKSASYVVRNIDPKQSQFELNNTLNQNAILNFESGIIKWYKVYDGNDGSAILGINKLN